MATISSLGVGSGINAESIVTQLMSLERRPLTQIASKETAVNSKISAFGTLKGLLDKLRTSTDVLGTPSKLTAFNATSSSESVLKATASGTAAAGTYALNVRQLATAHKLTHATAITGDSSTVVNSGAATSFTITLGGTTKSVAVEAGATLSSLRTAINGADAGVTANIVSNVNGGSTESRLVLTAKDTGKTLSTNLTSVLASFGSFQTAGGEQGKHAVVGTTIFGSQTEALGGGKFNITVGSTTSTVDIPSGSTLADLPGLINGSTAAVTASLVGSASEGWCLKMVADNQDEKISYSALDTTTSNAFDFTALNNHSTSTMHAVKSNTEFSPTFTFGSGSLVVNVAGANTSFTFPSNVSMQNVVDEINGALGSSVTAEIATGGSGNSLKISAKQAGNTVSYSFSDTASAPPPDGLLSGLNAQTSLFTQSTKTTTTYTTDQAVVDAGIFSLNVNGSATNVTVPEGSKVADLISLINNTVPGLAGQVTASFENFQLKLSGANNTTIDYVGVDTSQADSFDFTRLGGFTDFGTPLQSAQKALLNVEGVDIESESNDISTAVSGITFNLKGTGSATLTVDRNQESATKAVDDFVSAFNALNSQIRSYTAYDSANKKANTLTGDSATRSLQSQIQNIMNSASNSGSTLYATLSDIGISVGTTGNLSVDSTKLTSAITADFSSVSKVLDYYGSALYTKLGEMTASNGVISSKTDSLKTMLTEYTRQKDSLELRLTAIEKRYRAQFSALDSMIGKMQTTSSFLTQQLAKF